VAIPTRIGGIPSNKIAIATLQTKSPVQLQYEARNGRTNDQREWQRYQEQAGHLGSPAVRDQLARMNMIPETTGLGTPSKARTA